MVRWEVDLPIEVKKGKSSSNETIGSDWWDQRVNVSHNAMLEIEIDRDKRVGWRMQEASSACSCTVQQIRSQNAISASYPHDIPYSWDRRHNFGVTGHLSCNLRERSAGDRKDEREREKKREGKESEGKGLYLERQGKRTQEPRSWRSGGWLERVNRSTPKLELN